MSDVIERQKDILARHIRGENEHDWLGTHCRALGKIGTKIISDRPYPEVAMRCLLVFTVVLFATVAATPQASPDETAVRNIIQEEITAWNSSDAAAYSRHFAADGTFTNIRGEFFSGRQPFIEKHDSLFKGPFHGSTLKQDIVSLKFVRLDVAVVEVLTSVTGIQKLFPGTNTDDKGRLRTRLLQVVVKDGGEWRITAYHNTDVKSGVPVPDPQ